MKGKTDPIPNISTRNAEPISFSCTSNGSAFFVYLYVAALHSGSKIADGVSRGVHPVQDKNRSPKPAAPFLTIPAWWRRFLFHVLSPRELAVYVYICSLLGQDSLAFPTQAQIAQELGISNLDTIAKATKKLIADCFLIRNTQQIRGFQRTVYQRPAPEFTLIRLLDSKAIDYDLYPFEKDPDRFNDDLDTTQSAIDRALKDLLGTAFATYKGSPRSLRGLLAARFFQRAGYSYEEAWATLQAGATRAEIVNDHSVVVEGTGAAVLIEAKQSAPKNLREELFQLSTWVKHLLKERYGNLDVDSHVAPEIMSQLHPPIREARASVHRFLPSFRFSKQSDLPVTVRRMAKLSEELRDAGAQMPEDIPSN